MSDDSFSPATLLLALLISAFVATVVYGQARFARWYHDRVFGQRIFDVEATSTVRFNHDTNLYEEDNNIPLVELPQTPTPSHSRQVHFETLLPPSSLPPASTSNDGQLIRFPPSAHF
jgi:hypothetical protein